METIFDFNPTKQELSAIRFDSFSLCLKFGIDVSEELTPELYKKLISQENSHYDLACLFEFRGDQLKADEYWNILPKAVKEHGLGFDCLDIAI